ncbi:TolC family outer membrane protein [Paraglaciecola chathamensis]|uniref:Outer membrane protein n=2 Tax=Paraglaciecola chathamensis TaxID=368405 RepID=A0A8H9IER6_9ALTE|nr:MULTISPECIES: TolC family outer membrane protein [Paraglaciecola]AEE22574.1 type I secretion outer membrane protein, TolC family [Glaciecola sp. 4H-3-7+YE-5]GAC10984.1 TolC family type I secretion outer membrane protein [Paraglaciecola chathamensis S18K6]GGZ81425.1 outer membrane protein [Paraglaciecola oceanifecundans]
MKFSHLVISISFLLSSTTYAQEKDSISNAILDAIETNPDVQATWHTFYAAKHSLRVAKAGNKPTIDLVANTRYQDRNYGSDTEFSSNDIEMVLTQSLYNGSRVKHEVNRFRQIQMVRYFEFANSVENAARETALAYLDVQQYQALVKLAQENLTTHEKVFSQIEEGVSAGVTRAADLEQINGRLALSESNVITDVNNLYDVSARFLRIVGRGPKEDLQEIPVQRIDLPNNLQEILEKTYRTSPSFFASMHNIEAEKLGVKTQKSNYKPQVDFIASYGSQGRDQFGLNNTITEGSVGLQFRYNLFRGGQDKASIKQAQEQVNVAKDLRDKTCRDVRQNIQIAFNEYTTSNRLLPVLNQHKLSSSRVKTAYKDQFDIGQRTLLDVLDAENEYFESSRAYIDAQFRQKQALINVLAEIGILVKSLEISINNLPNINNLDKANIHSDIKYACPKN